MNLYHLTQDEVGGYDTYSDCVVCAETEEDAVTIHPNNYYSPIKRGNEWVGTRADGSEYEYLCYDWPTPDKVKAILLGKAEDNIKRGVVCASFHAG